MTQEEKKQKYFRSKSVTDLDKKVKDRMEDAKQFF